METESHGHGILSPLVRLFARARSDVQGHQFRARAMAHRTLRRQAPGAAEHYLPPVTGNPVQAAGARAGSTAQTIEEGPLRRSSDPARDDVRDRAILMPRR